MNLASKMAKTIGFGALLTGLILTTAGQAVAAPDRGTEARVVKTVVTVATPLADEAPRLAASCRNGGSEVAVWRGNHLGYACSGTNILDLYYSDGRWETFVIGTTNSNNIYHIWQRWSGDSAWSGWTTLPGNGTANAGIWLWDNDPIVVYVLGTDNYYYCNRYAWSGWYRC